MYKPIKDTRLCFRDGQAGHRLLAWWRQAGMPLVMTALVVGMAACANVVSPTGGPKDETPPTVIRSIPENFSPNFSSTQIRVFFDEFVTLSNLRQQLLVSPPMEIQPEIRIKGRSIIIDIEEELRPNTTYNLFFGDAIRDITEGNPIENFQFVFSTGDYVDSLSLGGTVVNAFTLQPEEGVSVMLYENPYDSIPYKERPVYFSRTSKEGQFLISNMREGSYLLFALKDNNANYLFDLPDEMIAFSDSLVSPVFVAPKPAAAPPDSSSTESSYDETPDSDDPGLSSTPQLLNSSTPSDSIASTSQLLNSSTPSYTLHLFQQADTLQRITSTTLVARGQVRMTFRVPFDSVCARDIRGHLPDDWYVPEFSSGRDTLTLWLRDLQADSLFMEMYDCLQLLDTVKMSIIPREARERRTGASARTRETDAASAPDTLAAATAGPLPLTLTPMGRRGAPWPYFMPFSVRSSAPLAAFDPQKILLVMNDSITVDPVFSIREPADRVFSMESLLEQKTQYTFNFLPGALTDMFGGTNDSIEMKIRTNAEDDFGMIILNLELPQMSDTEGNSITTNFILQLLDRDNKTLSEKHITSSGIYRFPHLTAGNYGFRLVEDSNANGRWDTGHYLKGVQPERVYMYPEVLQVRQNWETEESWRL